MPITDGRRQHREPRERGKPCGPCAAPSSGHYISDRLNDVVLGVSGSSPRAPEEVHELERNELVQRWHQEVQEHFSVDKDQHGHEHPDLKDGFHDDTDTGCARN